MASVRKKKEDRAALRTELYDRVKRGEISLVEAVRTMRKIAGKTQAEYARLVGVGPRVLIDFERGVGNPTIKTLEKMLRPFNLELTVRRKPEERD
ncbi:helix-turn-helix domain-containing protein [Pendulispora brunnea]|uniref:Helix-turn-helix domain-containing protein n=1 Tax=Pendulispora brunnea TaxID=2905690 RepID=A0ABZ2KGF5_9BACT